MSPFSLRDYLYLAALFSIIFLLVFISRSTRLHGDRAIVTDFKVELLLHERTDLEGLSNALLELGLDINSDELIWAGQTLGWRFFRPGRYEIEGATSYSDFLSKAARGLQDPARVTIIPGTDIARLSRSLGNQMRADSSEFHQIFSDSSSIALEFGLSGEHVFARMLPNTYEMYWTSSVENTIRRVLREFERLVEVRYQSEIESNELTLDEILTLASIVEWEARFNDEKPKISGLYLNRLDRNMMLQADPTVAYALGERRRLLFEDYRFEHPYNTYLIQGLPPGPITNPDLSSIRAVLNPEQHDYLFMVATPEGTHHFSRTFQEHREASEVWRRWIREQTRIREEQERAGAEG
ncbi:MAG: endolytic transglycosylase MltG [Balneolaceae bacterium]|nr:endolytic transglycosylase MltG [Balneolaceae bacterium]